MKDFLKEQTEVPDVYFLIAEIFDVSALVGFTFWVLFLIGKAWQ